MMQVSICVAYACIVACKITALVGRNNIIKSKILNLSGVSNIVRESFRVL